MLGVADVLGIVDRRGPLTLDELEAAASRDVGFSFVLDACVDSGWLDARGWGQESIADSRYCLTDQGRQVLDVARRCALAA